MLDCADVSSFDSSTIPMLENRNVNPCYHFSVTLESMQTESCPLKTTHPLLILSARTFTIISAIQGLIITVEAAASQVL